MTALAFDLVLRKVNNLPSLPAVVLELLASMDREDTNIDALARQIAQDQALTAKTLRLANSSFYGMARQITTMAEAITILGFRTVRSLATAAALVGCFTHPTLGRARLTQFWRHSIATAVCARGLATQLKLNPEHAYTVGLLHDIGRLVLATQFPREYEDVLAYCKQHDCPPREAELAVLGVDHAAIGHALAQHWGFPQAMQQAIAHHHTPAQSAAPPLPGVILVADALAHALDLSGDEDDLVPAVPKSNWEQLGLDDDTLLAVMARAEQQFAGASLVLNG